MLKKAKKAETDEARRAILRQQIEMEHMRKELEERDRR